MLNAGTPAEAAVNGLPVSYYAPPDYVPGNAPYYDDPKARDCGIRNENLAVKKRFPVIRERFKLEMGMDAVNIFNRHRWTLSDTNIGSLTFGQIQPNQRYGPRNIQLHLRMDF
jgi:hypothetical protein